MPTIISQNPLIVLGQLYALTKPKVLQLIVFCALVGMVMAVPGIPTFNEIQRAILACAGIWLVAGAAAAINCLVEKEIDAKMKEPHGDPRLKVKLMAYLLCYFPAQSAQLVRLFCISGSIL
jgi:protoheme IX farnesyltransferase